ncbi:ABC transporter permease [Candidatus Riflebacteria bacterium]
MSKKSPAFVIFKFTFLEAVRSRLFYVLLILAALVMGLIAIISSFSFGVHVKFLKDFSYTLVSMAGLFLTLFVSFDKIINELEETTIYSILSKPVTHFDFILGKFMATLAIVIINVVVLGFMVLLVLYTFSKQLDYFLFLGIFFLILKLCILTSMVFLISLATTKALTLPLALFIYLFGHVSVFIKEKLFVAFGGWATTLVNLSDYIFPNFLYFDVEGNIIHNYTIPPSYILLLLLYTLAYTCFFLVLTHFLLKKRDL